MNQPSPSVTPPCVPRFVRNLNQYAADRGIDVDVHIGPYDDDPEIRLWSNWRTTRARFLSLGLLSRGQPLPSKRGTVSIPGWLYREPRRALLIGELSSAGDDVLWQIDWGPGDFTITNIGEVEIVTSACETLYHGTAEALLAHGVERKRLPLGKKPSNFFSCIDSATLHWWSRRQLDDTIVYRVESASVFHKRAAEDCELQRQFAEERRRLIAGAQTRGILPHSASPPRPYLRLVVDNT
ncbi:MAG: hypothetical protein WD793_02630 [Steroidobacteraceae bacterium]